MPDQSGLTVVQRWLLRHAQRNPRADLKANYTQLLRGATGRAAEIGCGPGQLFAHYPPSVTSLIAVEINPMFRGRATDAAAKVSLPIEVVEGNEDGTLPLADGSADVVVCCEVLCSAAEPRRLLAEAHRVLRPGGELRVYEHSLSTRYAGRLAQRTVDVLGWPRMLGGCHAARDVFGMVGLSGFVWKDCRRLWCARLVLTWPIGPHVLGVAVRA